MYAGQPPPQQPFPPGTPPGPPSSANASYVLRVHAASETDHRGMLLIEEFQVMPDGATYVKQHRVPPNAVTPFVQQFAQQHPNVRVQQAGGGSGQQPAPQAPPSQQPYAQSQPSQGNAAAPSPFSTSSIGGLDGYDKYGSSYGSFAAVQAGRTGAGSGTGGVPAAIQQAARASGGGGAPAGQPQPYAGC